MKDKFKIGDKVREIATGDEGLIDELHESSWEDARWYVRWTSGSDKGTRLHISECNIELISNSESPTEITFGQAMQVLLELGYKVTLEKI
jgi:hypothetical protein